jgi:hypothetical protein
MGRIAVMDSNRLKMLGKVTSTTEVERWHPLKDSLFINAILRKHSFINLKARFLSYGSFLRCILSIC